jgi:hypothetical protein
MKKITLTLIGLFISFAFASAGEPLKSNNEAGIFVGGEFSGFVAAHDGNIYLLSKDHRLIKASLDGKTGAINLPPIANSGPDDYLCDISAGSDSLSFCGYPFSGIFVLNLKNPEKLDFIGLSHDNQPINPLMLQNNPDGWLLKDSEERVFKVLPNKSMKLMPNFSELVTDASGKTLTIPPPEHNGEEIVYPAGVFNDEGKLFWKAPQPLPPANIMSIEYLGNDPNSRDIFLVNTAAGELNAELTLYAVQNGSIVASRKIPDEFPDSVMRPCRLAPDGSIILLLRDPNGKEGVVLKKIQLVSNTPAAG